MPRKKKKKKAKKKPARRPARAPVRASEDAPKRGKKKKKPTRQPVKSAAPEAPPKDEPQEEVITVLEVELGEVLYDKICTEAQTTGLSPSDFIVAVLEKKVPSGSAASLSPEPVTPVMGKASGNLVDEDDIDPFIEDPDFQDAQEDLIRRAFE